MDKARALFLKIPYVSAFLFAILSLTNGLAEAQEITYSDCAYIDFSNVDPSKLTLQERIALEEAALFDSLDKSAECMEDASVSASGSLADAAGGGSAAANSGAMGSDSLDGKTESGQHQAATPTSSERSGATKDHTRGNSTKGSSAVCDAVTEGLAAATTESEKAHFSALMAEYGCQ